MPHFGIQANNVDAAKTCDTGHFGWRFAPMPGDRADALPPQNFSAVGRCAYVEDGQGNMVGMIEPEGDA